jgi:deoxyribonuclease IV
LSLNKRPLVGLHLKLESTLENLIKKAEYFPINIFQFFLVKEYTGKYPKLDNKDVKQYLRTRKKFDEIYIHSSYWINLASGKNIGYKTSQKILKKEIELSKKLLSNYLVLHPGSATKFKPTPQDPKCKLKGIENIVKALNDVLKTERYIKILLENTAHANKTIGSDLNDFKLIKERLDFPEKVKFCLDFAHAFSYGYKVNQTEDFIKLVDKTMGFESIQLLHLNDSKEERGSRIDKHEIPGKGLIGEIPLKSLIMHKKFQNIPLILELPNITTKETLFLLKKVYDWM